MNDLLIVLIHRRCSFLDERAAVLLVVEGVPEVPAVVVEDAEVVGGEAVLHEVPVEVAVPRDLCWTTQRRY